MKVIADLHIHSRYARACSLDLNPANLALWAEKKGITVLGTGDFTHPAWFEELRDSLIEANNGLYKLKNGSETGVNPPKALFMLSAEVASIYKQGDKVRRVHNLLYAPNFETVEKLNKALIDRGVNLKSDGRPIMGLHCDELLKIIKDVDERIELIPAHAWTPHFGVFGSLSGFDSLEECYGDMAKYIFAIETGLSSDPKMNWQIPLLDNIALISNSDAHSLRKLGREANVFEIAEDKLSYEEIIRTIKEHKPNQFIETLEFFPEEGKYFLDGHRDCKFSCEPKETKRLGGVCPVCGKKLLRGVMARVEDLSSGREFGFKPSRAVPFRSIIPLEEIIAESFGVGTASKKVVTMYEAMVSHQTEFALLLESSREEIEKISNAQIAANIIQVREGRVDVVAGYDGEFGKIRIK